MFADILDWAWAHPWIALALLWFTPLGDILATIIAGVFAAIYGLCLAVYAVFRSDNT